MTSNANPIIYYSDYVAPAIPTNMSLFQFMQHYNPDNVPGDTLVLTDDWTDKQLTFQAVKTSAARGAQGLIEECGLKVGDVVAISGMNSVWSLRVL